MPLKIEDRKKYRELFWDDYRTVIDILLKNNPETFDELPNKNKRIAQILIQYFMPTMWRLVDSATVTEKPEYISSLRFWKSSGITWIISEGEIKLTHFTKVKLSYQFFLYWFYLTTVAISNSFKRGNKNNAVIILDFTKINYFRNNSFQSILDFFKKGPIEELREVNTYILQGESSCYPPHLWANKYPLLEAIKIKKFDPYDPVNIARRQLRNFFLFFKLAFNDQKNYLLYKDLPYQGLAEFLNDEHFIKNVFQTQSGIQDQKLWLTDLNQKKFQLHMLWYSTNSKAIRFASDQSQGIQPGFYLSRADINYVWNANEANWLQSFAFKTDYRIVSPILFYLPEKKLQLSKNTDTSTFNIVIFDVAPHLRSTYTPSFYLYYTVENSIKLIDDIVNVLNKIENETKFKFNLFLKPKRKPSRLHHDPAYIDFLETKPILILPPDTNVFDLLSQADISIITPYSSPMFIDSKNSCIYHDPTGGIINEYPDFPLSQTRDELEKFILKKIENRAFF